MNLKEVLQTLVARLNERGVEFALSGGLALSSMGIFRFTNDLDFLLEANHKDLTDQVMRDLGYEMQDFSTEEIVSYLSPLRVFGQVDFLLARRKYTRAMLARARKVAVFGGEFEVKTILPEDLIGLKVQAIHNDPVNRLHIDSADIRQILARHKDSLDMGLVREYFKVFDREGMLDEWLGDLE